MKSRNLLFIFIVPLFGCSSKIYKRTINGHYTVIERTLIVSDSCFVVGQIIDILNKSPIPYGWIRIKGTMIGITSDSLGKFSLKIPAAKYKFVATSSGNKEQITKAINVEQSTKVTIDFYLGTNIIY